MEINLTKKEYKLLTDVFCSVVWDKIHLMDSESLYLTFQIVGKLKLNDELLSDLKKAMGFNKKC